mgnify:CR=1 FL=1
MNELKCPICDRNFEKIKNPDLVYEKCHQCNSIYLDKGELNTLTTGMAGDIETHFINIIYERQNNTNLSCPKCHIKMHKAHFGNYSNIYFDYCEGCGGSFMKVSEQKIVNDYLTAITSNKSEQELREFRNGYLVRVDVDQTSVALSHGMLLKPGYTPQNYLIITVFYKKPLDINLVIKHETFILRLLKLLFGNRIKKTCSGNKKFDNYYRTFTNNEIKFKKIFNETLTMNILEFVRKKPTVYGRPGKLTILDDKLSYREGPYIDSTMYNDSNEFNRLITGIVEITRLIDKN